MKHNDLAGIGNAMSSRSTPLSAKNVKTKIERSFLHLVDTHFPAGHKLQKIFNRNAVKVRYSCMNNIKSIITNHSTRIIRNQTLLSQKEMDHDRALQCTRGNIKKKSEESESKETDACLKLF